MAGDWFWWVFVFPFNISKKTSLPSLLVENCFSVIFIDNNNVYYCTESFQESFYKNQMTDNFTLFNNIFEDQRLYSL